MTAFDLKGSDRGGTRQDYTGRKLSGKALNRPNLLRVNQWWAQGGCDMLESYEQDKGCCSVELPVTKENTAWGAYTETLGQDALDQVQQVLHPLWYKLNLQVGSAESRGSNRPQRSR